MRKIFIWIGVLLVGVIGMAYLYFSALYKDHSSSDISLQTIANHSGIVFTFDNDKSFYDILSGETVLDDILGDKKLKTLSAIRQNLVSNQNIQSLLNGQKVYVGFVANNKDIDFVIATQAQEKLAGADILKKSALLNVANINDQYQLTFPDSSICYLKIKDNLILLSNSPQTIEVLSNEQAKSTDFTNYVKQNARFGKNTLANVFVDFNKIPALLKPILNSNLTGELALFNKQDTYATLSYNYSSDKLLLNGYTNLNNQQSYYNLFLEEQEQKITIDQLLPEKTANYILYTVNDYKKWGQGLKKWLTKFGKSKEIEQQLKHINEKYRIDLNNTFPVYFEKQFGTFQLQSGEKLGIISINNGEKLAQLLLDLSSDYANSIRVFKERGILFSYFGEPFKKFERPFYTVVDNHLVVANNASTVQSFLNSYDSNQLLSNTQNYINFKDQISNSATIFFYTNNKNSQNIFSKNLKNTYYRQYKSGKGFKYYNAFGYQLSSDNGKFMSNVLLLKNQTPVVIDSLSR
jgi:hypothetical protein